MDFTPDDKNKQKFYHLRDDLRNRTEKLTSSGMNSTATEFSRLSSAFHAAADKLQENNDYFAGFIDNLADKLDNVSNYIKERESKDLLHDLQNFAQKNPYLTIGGMFVTGMAVSRLLKAETAETSNTQPSREDYNESGR
jgi:ElaB/YqjD/DUF883 family membrane-anchored ribosome-binding protein